MNKSRRKQQKRIRRIRNTATKHRKTFQKMNCSPAVNGKSPVADSCFTTEVLMQIKDSYNKFHTDLPIASTDPTMVWKELKEKLSHCSSEDCWLSEIKDKNTQTKLDQYLFAPDMPDDWKGDAGAWLSNFDIMKVLKQYEVPYPKFVLLGPTPIDFDAKPDDMGGKCVWDELCQFSVKSMLDKGKTKIGVVFNLDKHNQKGSHWVSMFIDLEDNFIFYLDSAGEKVKKEIKLFVNRVIKQGIANGKTIHFYENFPLEHQMGENECGMYVLYFIITMLTGKADGIIFKDYVERIDFFKTKRISDTYMNQFRKKYFNRNLSM